MVRKYLSVIHYFYVVSVWIKKSDFFNIGYQKSLVCIQKYIILTKGANHLFYSKK